MEAGAAELDKTIAAPDPDAPAQDAAKPGKMRGLYLKKRLVLYGGGALALLLLLALLAGVVWKLRARPAPPPAEAEKPAATAPDVKSPLDVRPPLPDIRPKLHLLPPEQVFHAPRAAEETAEAAPAPETKPAVAETPKPAETALAKPPAAPEAKPAAGEPPAEKAPEAPVSIFVTRKEKKAVGDCTVEAKPGTDQKELRTRGLADCIRLFNETDRAGK
jgi:hypothetical protein